MIIVEFIYSSIQFIIIFSSFAFFVLTLLFDVMSGMQYYYYKRDTAYLNTVEYKKDARKISKTFNILKNIETVSTITNQLNVKASFGKIKLKRTLPLE